MSKIISKPCHKHLKCLSVCPPVWKWARKTRSNRVFRPAGSSSGARSPCLPLPLLIKRAPVHPVVFGPGLIHSGASFARVCARARGRLSPYLSQRPVPQWCCEPRSLDLSQWPWGSSLRVCVRVHVSVCVCVCVWPQFWLSSKPCLLLPPALLPFVCRPSTIFIHFYFSLSVCTISCRYALTFFF